MHDRRQFIKTSSLISLTPVLPTFLSSAGWAATDAFAENGRILVVVQLNGGNDGINTVVPFKDEGYAKHRKELRLPEKQLIKLDEEFAFHPRLRSAGELFEDGRLSVVHGVGYPNPNRSHFESMAIWHAGSTDQELRQSGNGWIGDAVSKRELTKGPHAIHVGRGVLPVAVRGRRCTATSIATAEDLRLRLNVGDFVNVNGANRAKAGGESGAATLSDFLTKSVSDAYVSAEELSEATNSDTAIRYPGSKLAGRLKLVSQMIKSGAAARVYYTSQGNYDTHAGQLSTHANLLGELSSSLKAFLNDLKESGLEDRVLVMAFSEFGRRVRENASLGTDHGTAGPVLLAGSNLSQRNYGQLPRLTDLAGGDLKHSIDFRSVYAGVLSDWLGLACPDSLKGFSGMKLFESAQPS